MTGARPFDFVDRHLGHQGTMNDTKPARRMGDSLPTSRSLERLTETLRACWPRYVLRAVRPPTHPLTVDLRRKTINNILRRILKTWACSLQTFGHHLLFVFYVDVETLHSTKCAGSQEILGGSQKPNHDTNSPMHAQSYQRLICPSNDGAETAWSSAISYYVR